LIVQPEQGLALPKAGIPGFAPVVPCRDMPSEMVWITCIVDYATMK